jgi:prophage maintenance system killer protein
MYGRLYTVLRRVQETAGASHRKGVLCVKRHYNGWDGNKRTGFAAAAFFVRLNGYRLIVTNEEVIKFVLETARSEHSIDEITDWLRTYTNPSS